MLKLIAPNGDVLFHLEGKAEQEESAEIFKFPETRHEPMAFNGEPVVWDPGPTTTVTTGGFLNTAEANAILRQVYMPGIQQQLAATNPFWRRQPTNAALTAQRLENLQREMDGVLGRREAERPTHLTELAPEGCTPISDPGFRTYRVSGMWLHRAETRGQNEDNHERMPGGAVLAVQYRRPRVTWNPDALQLPDYRYDRVRVFRTQGTRYVVTADAPDRDIYLLTYWPEGTVCPGFEEPEDVLRNPHTFRHLAEQQIFTAAQERERAGQRRMAEEMRRTVEDLRVDSIDEEDEVNF
jgi:hypothetical protein